MRSFTGLNRIERRGFVIAAVLLAFAAAWAVEPAAGQNPAPTVTLTVDYGDGVTKSISNLAWTKGNTVLDAMKEATARPRGISFSFTGTGDAAVLTKIDDVPNEGPGKRNWQFWVNGAYGDRSFAVFELQAQDVVVWRFAVAGPGK